MQVVSVLTILLSRSSGGVRVGELSEDLFFESVEVEKGLFGWRVILSKNFDYQLILHVQWIDSLQQTKENSQVGNNQVGRRKFYLVDMMRIILKSLHLV